MNYRSILEVSKQLDASSVLCALSLVSAQWYAVSNTSELWDHLSSVYYHPSRIAHTAKDWFRECHCFRCIPLLSEHSIRVYTVPSMKWKEVFLTPPLTMDVSVMYTWLRPAKLLCCGGNLAHNTYEIDTVTGHIHQLGDINSPRKWSGIINCTGSIYILGGTYDSKINHTAEKYLPMTHWSLLPGTLHSTYIGLTPCAYSAKIYCVGKYDSVEVLDTDTEIFTKIDLNVAPCQYWTLSVTFEQYLVLISDKAIYKYDLKTRHLVDKRVKKQPFRRLWSNCPPVKIDNSCFFILNTWSQDGILKMDFGLLSVSKVTDYSFDYLD